MRNMIIILMTCIMAAGCTEYDLQEILLERPDISVTFKGREIYFFNPDKAQICFNEERGEYRMFDEDFRGWVILIWNERPVNEGQKISIDLDWGTKTSFRKEKGLEFEVMKTDGSGMVWLWNSSNKIGLTIKVF